MTYIPTQQECDLSLMTKAENLGHELRLCNHPRLADVLDIIAGALEQKAKGEKL